MGLHRAARSSALTARQLRSLHAAGESVADLCKSFKVSRATVYRMLDAA
ncbi:MAG: helix-turn-helix domain-containing protein [Actinobacteria bacterium]|nr:helix-turn-helix domain-containing protein [Actinomycetota bacterium]